MIKPNFNIQKTSILLPDVQSLTSQKRTLKSHWISGNLRGENGISQSEAKYINPECVISLCVERNPKKRKSIARFNQYIEGQSVAQYIQAIRDNGLTERTNIAIEDVAWDFNHGFIDIVPPNLSVHEHVKDAIDDFETNTPGDRAQSTA